MRIGLFDSGLGGLITARYLKALRPDLTILYYGDTAHLPYGDKSPAQVRSYAQGITAFLIEAGAEGIVIACNTASAVATAAVRALAGDKPVWDAISATLRAFEEEPPAFPMGVIGTYTTIRSGVYGQEIRRRWPQALIAEEATPLLVPLVEEGFSDHPAAALILDAYLEKPSLQSVSSLLLACTHYPLLIPTMQSLLERKGAACRIYNTAELLARIVIDDLQIGATWAGEAGEDIFWVSDYTERFQRLAERFWGQPLTLQKAPVMAGVP
jgi:glutamate racemase